MFERMKANSYARKIGEDFELLEEELVKKAHDEILSGEFETAFNSFAYLFYSEQSNKSAANALTACVYFYKNSATISFSPDFEIDAVGSLAKDAFKFLNKSYIYDEFNEPMVFPAFMQGLLLDDENDEKAIAVGMKTPYDKKTPQSEFLTAITRYQHGEDVKDDLKVFEKLDGDLKYIAEFAFAEANGFEVENLSDIAKNCKDVILLTKVFGLLNEKECYSVIAETYKNIDEEKLTHVIYYEIVKALKTLGRDEELSSLNEKFTEPLFVSNFNAAINGETVDREQEKIDYVQSEIDELTESEDYQLASSSARAFYNAQIRKAVEEAATDNFSYSVFVDTFVL